MSCIIYYKNVVIIHILLFLKHTISMQPSPFVSFSIFSFLIYFNLFFFCCCCRSITCTILINIYVYVNIYQTKKLKLILVIINLDKTKLIVYFYDYTKNINFLRSNSTKALFLNAHIEHLDRTTFTKLLFL